MEHLPGKDPQLWTPAVDVVLLRMEYRILEGWHVRVAHRHSGEEWASCPGENFAALTSSEALDVASASLWSLLRG